MIVWSQRFSKPTDAQLKYEFIVVNGQLRLLHFTR